jgi:hypothetical protein
MAQLSRLNRTTANHERCQQETRTIAATIRTTTVSTSHELDQQKKKKKGRNVMSTLQGHVTNNKIYRNAPSDACVTTASGSVLCCFADFFVRQTPDPPRCSEKMFPAKFRPKEIKESGEQSL